jgi:hypothetical protein
VYPFASNEHLVVAHFSDHRCFNHLHSGSPFRLPLVLKGAGENTVQIARICCSNSHVRDVLYKL